MRKIIYLFTLLTAFAITSQAQVDDMYYTPSKSKTQPVTKVESLTQGEVRDVDEYNRHGKYWSHYQKIDVDANGNDIIEFQQGAGVYPDSTYVDTTFVVKQLNRQEDADYRYSRYMSRFDDFYAPWSYYSAWYNPYWYGPYYYGSYYYPWYTDYAWGYPYGYYAWGYPYSRYYWGYPWGYYGWGYYGWGWPHHYVTYSRPHVATHNSWGGGHHGTPTYHNGQFGGRSNQPSPASRGTYRRNNNNTNFGGKSTPSYPSNNNSSFGSRSTGSFGGARSGGSFGGGSRSGGGHFGGRR